MTDYEFYEELDSDLFNVIHKIRRKRFPNYGTKDPIDTLDMPCPFCQGDILNDLIKNKEITFRCVQRFNHCPFCGIGLNWGVNGNE